MTDIGFTGHRHNNLPGSDLGLVNMNARFFVPSIGRFASADTLVPDPATPQSYNRYSYVRNRVLNFTDPTGHRDIATDQGGGGGLDIRLPLLSKGEAEKALKSIGQAVGTGASVLPVAGDVIDGYDFLSALFQGEYAEAGIIAGMAALPGSGRLLRGAGGEIVEIIARNLDETEGVFRRLDDEEILYQFSRPPRDGQFQGFPKDLRPGEAGMSCQIASFCNHNPIRGFQQQFDGRDPSPGDWVRETTVGDVRNHWGGIVDYDGFPGNPIGNPIGHATIYRLVPVGASLLPVSGVMHIPCYQNEVFL